MFDLIAEEAGKLPIKFERSNAPILPDVGSVFFGIRDHTGAMIAGYENVAVTTGPATFALSLTIPAPALTIASGKLFERRTIVVTFVSGGVTYVDRYPARVIPFLNHNVTPQAIRGFVGVTNTELEDHSIDITSAYFLVATTVGVDVMEEALISGTTKEIAANEMVLMRAVLDTLPSLRQRVAQEEQNGVKMFKRATIDFASLQTEAQRRLDAALSLVLGALIAETNVTIFAVTQDTDPVTGGA